MNRRGVGVCFCFIAAILESAHYISTAIFLSGVKTWSKELFFEGLGYTGNILDVLSVIALCVGIVYLVMAEIEKRDKK